MIKRMMVITGMMVGALALAACEDEGVGEQVGEVGEVTEQGLEETGQAAEEGLEETGQAIEGAGDAVTGEAQEVD